MSQNRGKKGPKNSDFLRPKTPENLDEMGRFLKGATVILAHHPSVNFLRKRVNIFRVKKSTFSVQDEYKIYWLLITDYLRVYLPLAVTPMVISALLNVYLGSK